MSDLFITREQAENDLLAAAAYLGERIRSSDGHSEVMNAVLPLYLARGEVDLAAELANSVNDPYSRDKLLMLVAEKCASIDDTEYAIQLSDAIEDHGLRSQSFERVALVRAGKGDSAAALEIADTMAHPDFVLAGVAASQAAGGDMDAARSTVTAIDFPSAAVSAAQHIAATLIESSEPEKAVEWLETAAASAIDIEHDEERIRTLCEIGSNFVEARRNDKAVETFDTARTFAEQLDNTLRDMFLGNCALGFLSAGSPDLADQTLDLVTDKTQMASALVGFARDAWNKENKDDALDTLEEAHAILRSQRETETRDSRSRNRLFNVIAVQFAGFGKTDRAVELARENPDPAEETDAISQIAQVLAVQNEYELARQTINEIRDDGERLTSLIGLADTMTRLGREQDEADLLNEAAELVESIPQIATKSQILNELSARFTAHGDTVKAEQMNLENLELIGEVRDQSSKSVLLANLANVAGGSQTGVLEHGGNTLLRILGSV